MTRDQISVILDIMVSLDSGCRQISHHGDQRTYRTDQRINRRAVIELRDEFTGRQSIDQTKQCCSGNASYSTFYGFFRA